jgi:transposase
MTFLPALGLDIAKKTLQAALLVGDKLRHKQFTNDQAGFAALSAWLTKQGVAHTHVCLEATGSYSDAVARFLHQAGHRLSLVNPARIKAFAQSRLVRTKNDKVDAGLIARYCLEAAPAAWTPPAAETIELQALMRHLDALEETRGQLRNRLTDGPQIEPVLASLRTLIAQVEAESERVWQQVREHIKAHPQLKEQATLIDSIPGIGELTAAKLLGEITQLASYCSAAQVVAYAGLNPQERQSGTSIKGQSRISKTGNARLRKALYMPAISALQHNPLIRALGERLKARGLAPLAIVAAAMRKLLHLVFGVIKSGKEFNPDYAQAA